MYLNLGTLDKHFVYCLQFAEIRLKIDESSVILSSKHEIQKFMRCNNSPNHWCGSFLMNHINLINLQYLCMNKMILLLKLNEIDDNTHEK